MSKNECLKCGYNWNARVEDPECCPKCKSYDWNKIKKELKPVKSGDALNSESKGGKK